MGLWRRVLSWSVGWLSLAASWDIGLAEPCELLGDIRLVVLASLPTETNNPAGSGVRAAQEMAINTCNTEVVRATKRKTAVFTTLKIYNPRHFPLGVVRFKCENVLESNRDQCQVKPSKSFNLKPKAESL